MIFLIKLNTILLLSLAGIFIIILRLDRKLLNLFNANSLRFFAVFEQAYGLLFKALILLFYVEMSVVMATCLLAVLEVAPDLLLLAEELSIPLLIAAAIITIGSISVFIIAFRKQKPGGLHLITTSATEPALYRLSSELASRYNYPGALPINIVPGVEIRISEEVNTLDNILYGGKRLIEIGLASLQFLSAAELKALLARQYAYYENGYKSPALVIKRFNQRMLAVARQLNASSFILAFNPVFWFMHLVQAVTSIITRDYVFLAELKADLASANHCGIAILKSALAKYNVEAERYGSLIEAASNCQITDIDGLQNMYSIMKQSYGMPGDESEAMVNRLYNDYEKSRFPDGQPAIKLRLKRLPESLPTGRKISLPAFGYLADWRTTERRMMELLNSQINI